MRQWAARSDRSHQHADRRWPAGRAVLALVLGSVASCTGMAPGGVSSDVHGRGGAGTGDGGAASDASGPTEGGASRALGASGGSLCTPGRYLVCEGFEAMAVGSNVAPAGWTRTGDVDVIADAGNVYRGARAMRVNAAASGPRRITLSGGALAALGGSHWGRIFYKVQAPAPQPATGVMHSTLVAGEATSPVAGTIEVRVVDTVENSGGRQQFLYNVQPTGGRSEFARGSSYDWSYDGNWHCAEWHVDYANQSYHYYFDGAEVAAIAISNGAGNFANSEIPQAFTSLSVGWNNYQTSTPGFVAWFDEIALDPDRIGCGG